MRDNKGRFVKGSKSTHGFKKGHVSFTGENHPGWKGDKVGYDALHDYIERHFGKPRFCEACGFENAKIYDWANISGKYKRDKEDWLRLCRKCHVAFDDIYSKRPKDMYRRMWETRRRIYV